MKSANRSAAAIALVAFGLGAAGLPVAAEQASAAVPHHTVVLADAVKWGPAPPFLPAGAEAAVLMGNPGEKGPFVIRLKFPAAYTIAPHRHSTDEVVTVMAGAVSIGAGEKLDRAAGQTLPVGSFVNLPAGMPHSAWAKAETVVQINGTGPFDIIYVNPNDDPRKQ